MNLETVMRIIEILLLLPMVVVTQSSHVKNAKARIRHEIAEVRKEGRKIIHTSNIPKRYSTRRNRGEHFTLWTGWSKCNKECIKSRERYCRVKRKCGHTKHIEEKSCNICKNYKVEEPSNPAIQSHTPVAYPIAYPPIIHSSASIVPHSIPSYTVTSQPMLLPVFQEIHEPREESEDYFVIKKRRKYRKKRKPIVIEVEDYDELQDEGDPVEVAAYKKHRIKSYRSKVFHRNNYGSSSFENNKYDRNRKRNLDPETELYDYEDQYPQRRLEYDDEYADEEIYDGDTYDSVNGTQEFTRERAVFEAPYKYRRIYTRWSQWTKCTQKCTTRRYKKCRMKDICGREVLREIAYCYTEGSFCQAWLEGQIQKNYASDIKPTATRRKDVANPNSIATDFILSGKGYRGPEYRPLKLRCGIPTIKSGRRHLGNMLKIIGGKPSRKGEWPWQVVIFNRFKEAFCGGTLIAPRWVLTAAHCVRKVLYVRLGEHNMDYQDGTEMEFKVLKTIKHPNYDKKTVDSDIALLRLPKAVNATSWIGFCCMPHPYQPLPKNVQCTVIGWGKRRNRDQAGTSVLHQAEVPIISTDHCKTVYYDYSITKNMFCAGHKRGRIDTCAGDSGGPLLCRDTTKPNHPWTIFGITSFGDGCAKKNKFGIYAKVPNYVDWVWSVVNCNGNCKSLAQRRY